MTRITATGAKLRVTSCNDTFTTGSSGYAAQFAVDSAWNSMTLTALWRNGSITANSTVDSDGLTEIPWEVFVSVGNLSVGLFGSDGVTSLNGVEIPMKPILKGGNVAALLTAPTPSVYEQMVGIMNYIGQSASSVLTSEAARNVAELERASNETARAEEYETLKQGMESLPYIGENGNWYIYNATSGEYEDSGDPSRGEQGDTPTVVNDLTTGGATYALSAEQGKALNIAKAAKAATPTAGHIATLDADGNPTDSGKSVSDILDPANHPYGESNVEAALDELGVKANSMLTSIIVNNKASLSSWSYVLASGNVINNECIFTATARYGSANKTISDNIIIGHKYYFRAKVKATSSEVRLYVTNAAGDILSQVISHSGSGEYEILEGIFTSSVAIAAKLRLYDVRASGWNTIYISEAMVTDITTEYGFGYEPALSAYKSNMSAYNDGSTYILTTQTIYVNIDTSYKPRLYVDITSGVLNVICKYNELYDIRYVLSKKGINNIFDFTYMYKISNSTIFVSNDKTAGTVFWTNSTDSFGPFVIAADNNIDGDTLTSGFTGGAHGYNGDATGSATGRTASVVFFVDGRKVTSYAGYASTVDIEWINYVQAYNTKKADGTGREVLKETYRMHFNGNEWSVQNKIELLEDCTISTYYGLQLSLTPWSGFTLFQSSDNKQWYTGNIACDAGSKTCDIISHKLNSDNADMELSLSHGMGKGTYLTSATRNAFRANYNKSYFHLIDGASFIMGDVLTWKGKYKFYSV